ncbi:MAG: DUF3303 family protein [Chloroflexi bacterium]|nr:DUF3303 family protein [Chloroflexota bacterium]
MQFVTYFELNQNVSEADRVGGAAKIMEKGLFPPEGVNIVSWMTTPDMWGVLISEADTAEQVMRAIAVWRAAIPGFFTTTKTAPAMSVQDAIPIAGAINQAVNG